MAGRIRADHGYFSGGRIGTENAKMDIYRGRGDDKPIAQLRPVRNPTGGYRITDLIAGDPVVRGVAAAVGGGVNLSEVADGYLAALLALQPDYVGPICQCLGADGNTQLDHAAPLARRFTVDAIKPSLLFSGIWDNMRHAIGSHPLAARLYAAQAGSRALGWDLYADQVHRGCGFRGRTNNPELNAYMANISASIPVVYPMDDGTGQLIDGNRVPAAF